MINPRRSRPEPGPPGDLKSLLRDCNRRIQAHVLARLIEAGYADLRPAHANVLQFIEPGGSRIQDMATRAQVSWQAIAELVVELERLGYLTRVPDPTDRRARLVCLTESGRDMPPIAIAAMEEIEQEWAGRVGQPAMEHLKRTLQRLWEASPSP